MYKGTLIKDLLSAVEKAEQFAVARQMERQEFIGESGEDYDAEELESEKLA